MDSAARRARHCVLTFLAGTVTQEHKYSTMHGIGKDSVRLQRPPPSLTPAARALRNDIVSERTRRFVKLHAYDTCAESPCKRDAMRKQVGPRVWEHRQGLILTCTKDTLWAKFNERYANLLGETQYFMRDLGLRHEGCRDCGEGGCAAQDTLRACCCCPGKNFSKKFSLRDMTQDRDISD
jgi:hypothetical protein